MTDEPTDNPRDPAEPPLDFNELIGAALDGELTAADAVNLEGWLAADPANRRRFVVDSFVHRQVRDLRAVATLDAIDHAADDATPIAPLDERPVIARLLRTRARRRWAAAALVAVAAPLVVLLILHATRIEPLDPGQRQKQLPVAGLLMGAHDVRWVTAASDDGSPGGVAPMPEVGGVLALGPLAFDSGSIEIEFYSGARATIEGPASLRLDSTNGLTLRQGRLSAAVPHGAIGFTVVTPSMRVVDLGTEFGVVAGWGPEDEVHVFDGAVSMTVGTRSEQIAAGLGRAVSATGDVRPITAQSPDFDRPEPIVPVAYRKWVDYRNAIRADPSLVLYYTFQGQRPGDMTVEDHSGRGHVAELTHVAIADGRIPGKPAIRITGSDSHVRFRVPGEFQSLTAVIWINPDTLDHRFNSLMHTDGWDRSEPHWIIGKYGDLYFNIRDVAFKKGIEQTDIDPDSLIDGWHMMVGVFDRRAASVTFYIDGRAIFTMQTEADLPLVFDWTEIGNWRLRLGEERRWLNGRIDEFTLFDRAMTADEVRSLYEAGRVD